MSAFLPHHDQRPVDRAADLEKNRKTYQYCYTHVSPLALVERVPIHDEFSFAWMAAVAERILVGLANRTELELDPFHKHYHQTHHGLLSRMLSVGAEVAGGLKRLIYDALKFGRIGARPDRPTALTDYASLFRTIGLPPVSKDTGTDRLFAYMRVAGPNPVQLRRLTARDERFPITDADFAVAGGADSLEAAMAEGRAYIADYSILDGAEAGDYPHGRKYIYAPLALFVVNAARQLMPIAIQCRQQPGPDNPIFTPGDGHNWTIAKTIVEIADGNVHEAHTHLGRTHLFIEPFVVSTYRQLASNHPVAILLAPHFMGTLAINEGAWQHLIAPKGAVDQLFGGSIKASRSVAVRAVQTALVTKNYLPDALAERGVADSGALPAYPYRDDALLYWDAIREWVNSYIRTYYATDADVQLDVELAKWGRELAATDGGRLAGMPNGGAPAGIEELTDLLTHVVFTCSVQHAAVNFPQYDMMSYVPNMPLAAYAPAPTTKTGATEADYLALLPPMDMAELQLELGYLLGSVRYTQLGNYGSHFTDMRVASPLAQFRDRIAAAGAVIALRNQSRIPYHHLAPEGIPQSINI